METMTMEKHMERSAAKAGKNIRLVTAESVRKGHPDKLCDQIADAVLDAYLMQDPDSRVAVEVFATDGKILVAGEVSSKGCVKVEDVVCRMLNDIGYKPDDLSDGGSVNDDKSHGYGGNGYDPNGIKIEVRIHRQSPDIAGAVKKPANTHSENASADAIGAGDQGIMVGYATDEMAEYMPLPVVLAHRICRELDKLSAKCAMLGADGKAQVTVAYENGVPRYVDTIIVSAQHSERADMDILRKMIWKMVIGKAVPEQYMTEDTKILVNPSGRFVLGGPVADTGLTGRKLAVDLYGPVAHIGGGALSGKDASKTDRSGAYAARWVAKNMVAVGLAKRCEVQIAYAIGVARPVAVSVDTFGTGRIPDEQLAVLGDEVFDLSPGGIISALGLKRPIYEQTACYGHMGRNDLYLPWEQTDKKLELVAAMLAHGFKV